jgi:microcystin-dependent protein
MSQPYLGEIRMFAGNFAPLGWAFCNGQIMPISENDALFNLIGTTYGGDGQTTFALPDLRGRVPIHQGPGFMLANAGGAETITLTVNQIPAHGHPLLASQSVADDPNPANKLLGESRPGTNSFYQDIAANPMAVTAIGSVGGSQTHNNLQPFQCINFIIALSGIFPSPN